MSPATAPTGDADHIAPNDRRRQVRAALAFALVLGCVYQTLTVTDVTDSVIRLGIEADSYEMIWTSISWVGFMIVGFLVGAPLSGRFGGRITLAAGLAAFALGNLLCGMAVSLPTMILGRGVEGIGKGVATLAGRANLYRQFDRTLIFAIGFYGVFAYSTRYCSPMIAAVLNDQLSWRWIYWINVPIALAALAAVLATFRPDYPEHPRPFRVNWLALTLLIVWVSSLILSTGWYRYWGGTTSNWFVATLALDILCPLLIVAYLISSRGPNKPFERWIRSRVAILAMTTRGIMLVYMSAVLSIMGIYLTEVRGYPRPVAGLVMAPTTLTMALATILTTAWHRRSLRHIWLFVAVIGCAGCLWGLSSIDNFTPKERVAGLLALWGLFLGLFPPVFLTDEVEGQNPRDAAFTATLSLTILFLSMALIPTITKLSIKSWTDRAEDAMRQNISANRPEVEATATRVASYYTRGGLAKDDALAASKQIIGAYVVAESTVRGLRYALQFLSLIMLVFGLVVATLLFGAGRNLHAPPDSGYD